MKIVVTHVPAGSGHQRAAEAIVEAIGRKHPEVQTVLLNALDGADASYQWTFTDGYLGLVDRTPWVWGAAYELTDFPPLGELARRIHRWSNRIHGRGLETILLRSRPDVIIGTHFFPMEVAACLKRRKALAARLVTVLTDYRPHRVWIAQGIDTYVVAAEPTRQELIRRGISADRIRVLGIPIHSRFYHPLDRPALEQKLGLEPRRFTVLIVSGGFGTGPVERIVRLLGRIRERLQLLVVAGRNASLWDRLERIRSEMHHGSHVYPFVDNMDELMSVSDLMITKPGGLSCAEGIAKGLPMILIAPIPGQEARNARFVAQTGSAILAPSLTAVPGLVEDLRRDPARLRAIAQREREMAPPDPASAVAELAVS